MRVRSIKTHYYAVDGGVFKYDAVLSNTKKKKKHAVSTKCRAFRVHLSSLFLLSVNAVFLCCALTIGVIHSTGLELNFDAFYTASEAPGVCARALLSERRTLTPPLPPNDKSTPQVHADGGLWGGGERSEDH